ncbi:hypothetical protein [Streptomyces brasiliensis]|uniref:Thioesterase domain-containing protein n=1 Tax=Streptomyces brasiliensis TaxID=1954 RepID=A0A917K004_9ACTN|nr:hypothetical protein [Streptomyces brasiliensis]GGI94951.1 hypothetical protein GCM10010121_001620 [Streptomyces brasiliensis]
MAAGEQETNDRSRQSVLPGGHFFINESLPAMAAQISQDLREIFGPDPETGRSGDGSDGLRCGRR